MAKVTRRITPASDAWRGDDPFHAMFHRAWGVSAADQIGQARRIRFDAAILACDLKEDLHRIRVRPEIVTGGLEAAAASNQWDNGYDRHFLRPTNGFSGTVKTLNLNAKMVRFPGRRRPGFRNFAGAAGFGEAGSTITASPLRSTRSRRGTPRATSRSSGTAAPQVTRQTQSPAARRGSAMF